MNIEIKNADGEVVKAAPEMDLHVVADQVHKNRQIESEEVEQKAEPDNCPVDNSDNEEEKTTAKLNVIGHINNLDDTEILEGESEATITEEAARRFADALMLAGGDPTKLTDNQIASISESINEVKENNDDLKLVGSLPSNNNQEDHEPEEGEAKIMPISINPITGEHAPVLNDDDALQDNETFEEMLERVQNSDIQINDTPFSKEEFESYINSDKSDSIFKEISKDTDYDPDTIKQLLEVTNRKLKGEEFNVFKALPEKIQALINEYCRKGAVPLNTPSGNQFRNMITDELMSEFITNIGLNRIQTDFSKELEQIFNKTTNELSESIVGYTKERSKAYREAADKMEDPDKKAKLTAILDKVDEGYNLTELKEYAKSCKIKKYDLERPDKIFKGFVHKYAESKFNIYGIDMAIPIVLRNINKDADGKPLAEDDPNRFDIIDINAFFVAFCKQTALYDPNTSPMDHAYMYYTLYNCIFTDVNTGSAKDVSLTFLDNIREVIRNLRERNNNFGRS